MEPKDKRKNNPLGLFVWTPKVLVGKFRGRGGKITHRTNKIGATSTDIFVCLALVSSKQSRSKRDPLFWDKETSSEFHSGKVVCPEVFTWNCLATVVSGGSALTDLESSTVTGCWGHRSRGRCHARHLRLGRRQRPRHSHWLWGCLLLCLTLSNTRRLWKCKLLIGSVLQLLQ